MLLFMGFRHADLAWQFVGLSTSATRTKIVICVNKWLDIYHFYGLWMHAVIIWLPKIDCPGCGLDAVALDWMPWCWIGCRGVGFPAGAWDHFLFQIFQTELEAYAASCWLGTRASFPGLKQSGCETDHSPLSCSKVKDEWSCDSVPPVFLYGLRRDSFTHII